MSQLNCVDEGCPLEQSLASSATLGLLGEGRHPPELPLLLPQEPNRLRLQDYVPFAKGSGQTRGLSPMRFREPEPEKRHGSHLGAGPPHSPKLKVRGPSPPTLVLTS